MFEYPVVVTGGAGFIGSHLCEALAAAGNDVEIFDNFVRGSLRNVAHLTTCGAARLHHINLAWDVPEFPTGSVVFHLAALVSNISGNAGDQLGMLNENLRINANVVQGLRHSRPRLVVLASTVCVYPSAAPVPTHESAAWPLHPEESNEGYGLAKAVLEKQGEYLHRELGVPVVVARFSNAIGKRDYYDGTAHVVPALIRRVMEGENPLRVWGSGRQTRVFVNARQIAAALVALAETPAAHDARPVNIGHDREISIADLAYAVAKACGQDDLRIVFDTSYPDGHARRAVDNGRLRSLLGWVPDMPLEDSIAEMVEDYRARVSHDLR